MASAAPMKRVCYQCNEVFAKNESSYTGFTPFPFTWTTDGKSQTILERHVHSRICQRNLTLRDYTEDPAGREKTAQQRDKQPTDMCRVCGDETRDVVWCPVCKRARYCSPGHLDLDRATHGASCKTVSAVIWADKPA